MNKNIAPKIIALLSAGIITITSSFSVVNLYLKEKSKQDLQNKKSYTQILKDAEGFCADFKVVENLSAFYNIETPVKLKFEDNKPVIINFDKNIEEREKHIIEKVINYYNEIFKTINENYSFKINESESIPNTTTITFTNQEIKGAATGEGRIAKKEKYTKDGYYVNKATIIIDWNQIKNEDDFLIYSLVLHEFTHILGLGDVYFNMNTKNSSTVDMETIMNTYYWEDINALFPNDYACLQALYSNEYKKHDNYEDAVKTVNNKIEKYTQIFYEYYSQTLLNNDQEKGITTNLTLETLNNNIEWSWNSSIYGISNYKLELKENNACTLTILDKDNNILEICSGKYIYKNGMLFIRNIHIDNAHNYRGDLKNGLDMKLALSIYLNKNNYLIIKDCFGRSYTPLNKELKSTR